MKKKLSFLALVISLSTFAQVGINTPNPSSTLDITAKNATGTTGNVDGLLVPRVDRQRAQSMTGIPVSTLIYVNSIATGTQVGRTVNVDAVGYYYFNGTVWVKLHNPANTSAVNIYNSDGTLTGNRTVTQGANTLKFNSTATNGFSVDGSTFSVDAANNRIGIGTIAPATSLDVIGKVKITDGTQGANKILVSDANGIGSWRDPAQTKEAMVLANTAEQTVLTNVAAGASTVLTNFVQRVNTIPGASFNTATDYAYLPQGTYEVTISYEISRTLGACPPAGFVINSYFMDFANSTGILRVHSNAPSTCGFFGIHSALWVTTITAPAAGLNIRLHIGRGQGGNYSNSVLLSTNSRVIFKKIL